MQEHHWQMPGFRNEWPTNVKFDLPQPLTTEWTQYSPVPKRRDGRFRRQTLPVAYPTRRVGTSAWLA